MGIILGGAAEALLPATWVQRYLSGKGFRSTLVGGLSSLPGMMCSCCATPVVVGLRKRNASVGYGLDRLSRDEKQGPAPVPALEEAEPREHWALRWVKASARLAAWIIPEYLVVVGLTGFLGGFFFPAGIGAWAHGFVALVLIALAGTLFVIPTMAEIPIVQGLMVLGLPAGPAMALLLTLPTISLPSLVMAGGCFRPRTLVTMAVSVVAAGVLGGLVAAAFM